MDFNFLIFVIYEIDNIIVEKYEGWKEENNLVLFCIFCY